MTIGMTVPSQPSYSTHEHDFRNVSLTLTRSMKWRLARIEAEVCIDLCRVKPLFVDMYVVVYGIKLLIPRVHE